MDIFKKLLKSSKGNTLTIKKAVWPLFGILVIIVVAAALFSVSLLKYHKSALVSKEITNKRTGSSKTFYNEKTGKYTSRFYAQPVNYKDSSGKWQKIDTNVQSNGSKLEVKKAPYQLLFSKDVKEPVTFRVGSPSIAEASAGKQESLLRQGFGGQAGVESVSFQLTGIATPSRRARNDTNSSLRGERSPRPSASGQAPQSQTVVTANKVLYKNVYTNTDIERIATNQGLKQNYILKAKGHPSAFKETLTTKLTSKLQQDGSLNFYKGNNLVATASHPFLTDAKGKTVQLKYQLTSSSPDTRLLALKLPRLSGLKYPITIDPTITIPRYYGDYMYYPADTFVDSYAANQNFNSDTTMIVGKRPNTSFTQFGDSTSFLKYDLSLIPAGSIITNASLNVMVGAERSFSSPSPSDTVQVQSIDAPWSPNTVTWNNKPSYGNYAGSTRSVFPDFSYVSWDVTTLVSQWMDNTRANNGLALVKIAGEEWSYVYFYTSEYAAARYPYIVVTYDQGPPAPPPAPNAPTINSLETTSPSQITVNFRDNSDIEDDFHFYLSKTPEASVQSNQRYLSSYDEKIGFGSRKQVIASTDSDSGSLFPNTRYYLRAKGHNHTTDTLSSYSNEMNIVTSASAPENLTAITGWDAVNGYKNTLNWRDPDPGHPTPKYHVYYRTAGASSWTQIGGETVTGAFFTHTGLAPGKTYYYRVFSVNDAEEENPDYAKTSILSSGGVINAVSDADWSASEGYHVHLGWQDSDIFNPSPKYRVYASTDDINWTLVSGTINFPSYTHTGVSPGTNYIYRIFAVNSSDVQSADFGYTTIQIQTILPGAYVKVQQGLDGYSGAEDASISQYYPSYNFGSSTSLTIRKGPSNTRYSPLVKFDLSSKLPVDAVVTSATLNLYKPWLTWSDYLSYDTAVRINKLTDNWDELSVTWNSIGGGNFVEDPPMVTGAFSNGNVDAEWRSYNISALVQDAVSNSNRILNLILRPDDIDPNSAYWGSNAFNFQSKEATNKPFLAITYTSGSAAPVAPLISTTADSSTQITVNLTDQSANEDDFHFYSGTASGPTVEAGVVNSTSTNGTGKTYSKVLTGLSPNTRYYARTRSHRHNNDLFSDYSNEISRYTQANLPIGLLGKKIAADQIQLMWDANSNPSGTIFELYYGDSSSIVYSGPSTSFTQTTTNKVNTYRIRAKNGDGVATEWSGWIEVNKDSPHANYTQDADQCAVCHGAHTATLAKLLRGPQNAVYQADFCYSCHDGTGSIYNVKAAVDTNPSHHTVKDADNPEGVLDCTNCHDPHGVKKPDGGYYAKLLKSQDSNGNKFYEGNEFCGACHGPGSTLIGGDHLSIFNNIPHNTNTANPPSGTKIKCLNCHGNNNSSGSEGTAPHGSDYARITRLAEENLCYQCHDNAANSENNINIVELFSYPSSLFANEYSWYSSRHNMTDVEQADAEPGVSGDQPSKVECKNCHNPHKADRGDKKIANPDNVFSRFDAKRPDPKLWDYQDNKGFAVLMPFYRQLPISNIVDPVFSEQTYLTGAQTPADGQDTFVDSSKPDTVIDWSSTMGSGSSDVEGYGEVENLRVGKRSGGNLRSLIVFTELVSKIPLGSTINKAYLAWPQNPASAAPLDSTKPPISIYRLTTPWKEDVTWNKRPLYDTAPVVASSRGAVINTVNAGLSYDNGMKYLAWDVTPLVQSWVNLSYENLGLMLMSPEAEAQTGDYYASLRSSEAPQGTGLAAKHEAKPALVIQYSTSNPPLIQDINSFCLTCHDGDPPAGIVMPEPTLKKVSTFARTDSKGDVHGGQASIYGDDVMEGTTVGSYRYGMAAIQCTDCHEPHGNDNVYHFQKKINWIEGLNLKTTDGLADWRNWGVLCQSCHISTHVSGSCRNCHFHGAKADTNSSTNF